MKGETVPLKLYYSESNTDNAVASELAWHGSPSGYVNYYTLGHVYKVNDAAKSRVPLKMWYHESRKDHKVAVSSESGDKDMMAKGYKFGGFLGYGLKP